MARKRVFVLSVLSTLFLFLFLWSPVVFSSTEDSLYRLIKLVCERPVGSLRLWAWERDTAVQALKKQIRQNLENIPQPIALMDVDIDRLASRMSSPEETIQLVRGNPGVVQKLAEEYPYWERVLFFLEKKGEIYRKEIYARSVRDIEEQFSVLEREYMAWDNVISYYDCEVRKIVSEIEALEWVGGDIKSVLPDLKQYLGERTKNFSGASPKVQEFVARELIEISDKFRAVVQKLERHGGRETSRVAVLLEKLTALTARVSEYGLAMGSKDPFVIKRSFLMAQIRYGNLEAKKIAFYQLQRVLVDSHEVYFSKEILRDILSTGGPGGGTGPDASFREWVINRLRAIEGVVPCASWVELDALLQRCKALAPDSRAFREDIETMINMMMYPQDWVMGSKYLTNMAFLTDPIEMIGAIRASSRVYPTETANFFLENYLEVAKEKDDIFTVIMEELVGIAKTDANVAHRLEIILQTNAGMESLEISVRRKGIWGLSIFCKAFPEKKGVLKKILETNSNRGLQAEALMGLRELPGDSEVLEIARVFLQPGTEKELQCAAALYVLPRETSIGMVHDILVESLRESSIPARMKGQILKAFHNYLPEQLLSELKPSVEAFARSTDNPTLKRLAEMALEGNKDPW